MESLDHCCSSDDVACTFISFIDPFVLPFFEEYVKKHNQGSEETFTKLQDEKKKQLKNSLCFHYQKVHN